MKLAFSIILLIVTALIIIGSLSIRFDKTKRKGSPNRCDSSAIKYVPENIFTGSHYVYNGQKFETKNDAVWYCISN